MSTLASIPPLPALSAATLLRALFKRPAAPGATEPLLTRRRLTGPDAGQVARYRAALGFGGGHVPLTYWYLPAQRAHLATILDAAFPYRLVGAIHVDKLLRAGRQPLAMLDGRFRAPVPLGSAVTLAADLSQGHYALGLGGRIAVEGEFAFDAAQAMQGAYLRS